MSYTAVIIYGEGSQAYYYQEKVPYINLKGQKMIPIQLAPDERAKKRYGLTDDMFEIADDGYRTIWLDYPAHLVHWINRSNIGAMIIIECALDRSRTEYMSRHEAMYIEMEFSDKTIDQLRMENQALHDRITEITSRYQELFKVLKGLQDITNRKGEGMAEDDTGFPPLPGSGGM